MDKGVCSGCFSVEQGLARGCALAPLLFDIFMTAVLDVALAYFRLDPDIVEDMVKIRRCSTGARVKDTPTVKFTFHVAGQVYTIIRITNE